MRHRAAHASSSSLLLVELILSAGFIALTAAVCVQLYLAAHKLSRESADVTRAVNEAQNMAESYLAGDGTLFDAAALYMETVSGSYDLSDPTEESATSFAAGREDTEGILVLGYDEDWSVISAGESVGAMMDAVSEDADCSYLMEVVLKEDPSAQNLRQITITVARISEVLSDDGGYEDVLFTLETGRYLTSLSCARKEAA